MCSKLRLEGSINYRDLARLTPGYVGADLNALTAEAGMLAVKRIFGSVVSSLSPDEELLVEDEEGGVSMGVSTIELETEIRDTEMAIDTQPETVPEDSISQFLSIHRGPLTDEQLEPLCVQYADFVEATKIVQPSSKREGFATVPDVTWEDIGALSRVADELRMAVVEPIKHPEYFASVGITSAMGVLLYGPPGCGKTLLAKAVANESHCNFLSVKGPELLNKVLTTYKVRWRKRASNPDGVFTRSSFKPVCYIL
jgi:ribosome biogenesis ATPase